MIRITVSTTLPAFLFFFDFSFFFIDSHIPFRPNSSSAKADRPKHAAFTQPLYHKGGSQVNIYVPLTASGGAIISPLFTDEIDSYKALKIFLIFFKKVIDIFRLFC